MNYYKANVFKTFVIYPYTWLVAATLIILHLVFSFLFQPSFFWQILAFGLDFVSLGLWFVLALKSPAFIKLHNRMPYEKKSKELLELVKRCSPSFATPAETCIKLIDKINLEFPDQLYSAELALMLVNLEQLARNNAKLHERSSQFGTAEQKKHMQKLLTEQEGAIQNTLTTLKTFSGNLTLLAANLKQTQDAVNQLKDLNQGLKEVIEEI